MPDEVVPPPPAAPAKAEPPAAPAVPPVVQPVVPPVVEAPKPGAAGAAAQSAATEAELTLPKDMQIDQEVLGKFKEISKSKDFTPQKALDFYAESIKTTEAAKAKQFEAWQASQVETLKADPEFGKAYDANIELARKALREQGGAELVKELDAMGLGNHAGLVKFASRFGKALSEDSTRTSRPASEQTTSYEASLAQRYPSMYNADGTPK